MNVRLCRGGGRLLGLGSRVTVVVGNFDGVHRGHQALLAAARSADPGAKLAMVSFYPHPAVALGRSSPFPPLTGLRRKLKLISAHGVDLLWLIRFTPAFSGLDAEEFIDRFLIGALGMTLLAGGRDLSFGRLRAADADQIAALLARRKRRLHLVEFEERAGRKISSRRIRELLLAGRAADAAALLGSPFGVGGKVVPGDRRGRRLGFPTANLGRVRELLPANGVYAVRAIVSGSEYRGVANVGIRPTFGGGRPLLEVHLAGYQGPEFYGARMEVLFLDRIRDERRFDGEADLKRQIALDLEAALRARG